MIPAQVRSGLDDLLVQAEMAGLALGCTYSSSTEYEAAVIAERRKAGAYRRPVWQRLTPWLFAVASLLIVTLYWSRHLA